MKFWLNGAMLSAGILLSLAVPADAQITFSMGNSPNTPSVTVGQPYGANGNGYYGQQPYNANGNGYYGQQPYGAYNNNRYYGQPGAYAPPRAYSNAPVRSYSSTTTNYYNSGYRGNYAPAPGYYPQTGYAPAPGYYSGGGARLSVPYVGSVPIR